MQAPVWTCRKSSNQEVTWWKNEQNIEVHSRQCSPSRAERWTLMREVGHPGPRARSSAARHVVWSSTASSEHHASATYSASMSAFPDVFGSLALQAAQLERRFITPS